MYLHQYRIFYSNNILDFITVTIFLYVYLLNNYKIVLIILDIYIRLK